MNTIKKRFLSNFGLFFAIVVIVLSLMIIYAEVLDGSKSFYGASDKASAINVKEAISKSKEYPIWFPWMMGGIPSVHSAQNISDYYPPNYVIKALHYMGMPWFWNYILHFVFAGIGMYFLCSQLNFRKFASILSSLGFAITPYMTGMLVHGHGSQVMTLCYMPWVLYGYIRLREGPSIRRISFLSLFLALQLLRGHVQMAYYTWLMLGILILIDVVYIFFIKKQKNLKWLFYAISSLFLGGLTSLSLYIPMLSYVPFSTRSSGEKYGAGIEYVTNFSFSLGEIITFFIPSYYGFGELTYWGTMPFTNFPHYMSIILVLFAVYGAIRYKLTTFKIFSIFCMFFFLMLSFGKNFINFYTFFYNYLPFFSKLRNPAYLLIIIQFCTMILSGMGISMILKDIKNNKVFLPAYSICIIIIFCLIPFVFDLNNLAEKGYAKNMKEVSLDSADKIDLIKKQILDIQIKKKEALKDIDLRGINSNLSIEDIDSYKKEVANQYDLQLKEANNYIGYLNMPIKKTALTKSLINTDIWIMQLLVFITFFLILSVYYGYLFLGPYRYLSYASYFIILIIVFLDFYFVDRKITNRENPQYLLSLDAQSKYEDYYSSILPFVSRNPIAPLIRAKQSQEESFNAIAQSLVKKKNNGDIFRILDQDGGSSINLWSKYHIEDIGGYHPAKLKSYKDIFESKHGISLYILRMMNVRYVIQGQEIDWEISNLLKSSEDRAYFVKELIIGGIEGKENRFNSLYLTNNFPSDLCYLTSKKQNISWPHLNRAGDLRYKFDIIKDKDIIESIDNSNPNKLIIRAKTSGPQFLVVSEVFYPNGWRAFLNKKEVPIYEVNDLIRGISIDEEGEHVIEMRFAPNDLKWGKTLSCLGFIVIFSFMLLDRIKFFIARITRK